MLNVFTKFKKDKELFSSFYPNKILRTIFLNHYPTLSKFVLCVQGIRIEVLGLLT